MSGGTGRTGLTLVGQVVGSYFGPIGAAVGGMIGSAIGGAIWPEQLEGPKLEGLQITSSAYGGPIPGVYGTVRVAGNIFWASPIRETAVTESQGKGGGPEVTTYRYSVDLAIGLCSGPVVGVRRIWADQKLIYDVSGEIGTIFASYQRGGEGMRFYLGTDDQLPDPTIEAALGVGSTPAYRDLCYVTFTDFDLSEYGNRVPNINVEVIAGGSEEGTRELFALDPWGLTGGVDDETLVRLLGAGGELLTRSENQYGVAQAGYISKLDGTDVLAVGTNVLPPWPPNILDDYEFDSLVLWPAGGEEAGIYAGLAATNQAPNLPNQYVYQGSGTDITTDYTSVVSDGGNYMVALVPAASRDHLLGLYAEALTDPAGAPTYWILWRYESGLFTEIRRGTIEAPFYYYRCAGGMSGQEISSVANVQAYRAGMLESDLAHFWMTSSTASEIILNEIDSDDVMRTLIVIDFSVAAPTLSPTSLFADGSCAWVYMGGNLYGFTRAPDFTLEQTLDQVVSSICLSAGLEAGDITVTDLASTVVRGYVRTPRMIARAAIEPLMTAYAFDAVESDLKIKFVMRNATSIVDMQAEDLGAGDGEEGVATLVDSERTQESELPVSIDVSYMAVAADYQIGTQTVRRQVTESVDNQSIRLPLAFEDQEAAEICARMIYELWTARNSRKWSTTIKYSKYEPTDVVQIEGESATYKVRITDKQERGNLILWAGVDVDAAAFDPTITGQDVEPGGQTVTLPGITQLIAVDTVPLREDDFGRTGYYAAATGFNSSWPGALLFRQPEGGGDFVQELNFRTRAAMGGTLNALGRWGTAIEGRPAYGGYSPDFTNYVDVAMSSGTLSSCTYDEFLAFQNVALVGKEIIAFRDVEVIDSNIYRLSCLLRGCQATEWFSCLDPATADATTVINPDGSVTTHTVMEIDGHRIGDQFLVLDPAVIQRFVPGSETARIAGTVRGVTAGDTLGNTGSSYMTQEYASLVPPCPVGVIAYKNASSQLYVDFDPRTFVGGGWDDGREVTLDPSQGYAVHVINAGVTAYQRTFFMPGLPPYLIYGDLLGDVIQSSPVIWVMVSSVPVQYPSGGVASYPDITPRFWSGQRAVSW